tara:strand:+ start:1206 stop:1838 length:633 start_codon:yes stop_codon:yes gene_type:complete
VINRIKKNLNEELPGANSWAKMAVRSVKDEKDNLEILNDWLSKENLKSLKDAAILIALFEKDGEYCFPMIKRPENIKNHPGQIALPGGSKEKEESLERTALREAQEEIGIDPDKVEIIGRLTPIPVPVSGYLVQTYIGIIDEEPNWKLSKDEVADFFILKLSELLDADNEYYEKWNLRGFDAKVPIFKIGDLKIWGATASVLSEFIELTK